MRRYERARANEVCYGDSGVGPYLKTEDGRKHKVYVITLIDDASRHIVGIDVFFNDNFANLMSVMKSAVAKFGVLKLFNFDNGGSHKNKQMGLLAARIRSTVHYDQPYTPTRKAKAERRFRTMKDQWMAGLGMRDFHTLNELRTSLYTYVNLWLRLTASSMGPIIVFAKQRIRLRYSPDMESIYVVEADGTLTPVRLLNKIENADIKREKPRLYGGDD